MKSPVAFASSFVLAVLMSSPVLAAESAAAAKPDLAKGQQIATTVCFACHTVDGSRGLATYPILQGQGADYIVKQLTEFKANKRVNPIMNGMAAPLSEADMKNVAAFYASKKPVSGVSKNQKTVLQGEHIYRGGIAERKVPACAGCHGPSGAGLPSQYPRLGGQHAEYVEAQLTAFRAGTRANSQPMTDIASRMSDQEIKAVSDYIAGLR